MNRRFVVRNMRNPETFAGVRGWGDLLEADIYRFTDDDPALISYFQTHLSAPCEMVEIVFVPVRALN